MIDPKQLEPETKTETDNTLDQTALGKKRMRIALFVLLLLNITFIFGTSYLESISLKKYEKEISIHNANIDAQYSELPYIWKIDTGTNIDPETNDNCNRYLFTRDNVLYANICMKIYAYDIENGNKLWEKTDERISLVGIESFSNSKNNIIFGKDYYYLYALDAKGGKLIWKTETETSWGGKTNSTDRVILLTKQTGSLQGININNGKELWKNDFNFRAAGVTYNEGLFFILNDRGSTIAINELTGKIIWTSKTEERTNISVPQNLVFFRDNEGVEKLFLTNYNSYTLDPTNGKTLSQKLGTGHRYLNPIVLDNNLFVNSDNNFCAINTITLEKKWCIDAPAGFFNDTILDPTLKDNTIYFSKIYRTIGDNMTINTIKTNIFAIDIDDGKQIWKYSAGNLSGGLAIRNNFIATAHDDLIHILDRKTGLEIKKFPETSYAVDDENIYTLSPNGIIYAIPLITD